MKGWRLKKEGSNRVLKEGSLFSGKVWFSHPLSLSLLSVLCLKLFVLLSFFRSYYFKSQSISRLAGSDHIRFRDLLHCWFATQVGLFFDQRTALPFAKLLEVCVARTGSDRWSEGHHRLEDHSCWSSCSHLNRGSTSGAHDRVGIYFFTCFQILMKILWISITCILSRGWWIDDD